MPKGYFIGRVTVHDPEAYKAYAVKASAAIQHYGGKPIVRGGPLEAVQGEARPRNVVIEFESMEKARTFYFSPEYQEAVAMRTPISEGEFILVEGVD